MENLWWKIFGLLLKVKLALIWVLRIDLHYPKNKQKNVYGNALVCRCLSLCLFVNVQAGPILQYEIKERRWGCG